MKKIILLGLLFILFSSNSKPQGKISYQYVKGYQFVGAYEDKNIFLTIQDANEWANLFKPYPGHHVQTTPIDWQKSMVIAVVKYNNDAWNLEANTVELDEGELVFEYQAKKTDDNLEWKNASTLIVVVPKGKYQAIKYLENGNISHKIENFTGKRDY
ncbi:MAG: hypothetical protein SFU27_01495 [Thermonemataceae bacterium]|nr:hypothetical protein [Thermonemataceae bacterium]